MIPDDPGDGHIYQPEESDGRTDWPSRIAQLLLLAVLIGLAIIGWWALAPSQTHAAEQGPAGSTIPPFCRSHDQAMAYVTSAPYGEELWRMKSAHFASGKPAGVVEWTENKETGTWTILVSKGGLTCILFSGNKEGQPS
jgi:hypothetical protein